MKCQNNSRFIRSEAWWECKISMGCTWKKATNCYKPCINGTGNM